MRMDSAWRGRASEAGREGVVGSAHGIAASRRARWRRARIAQVGFKFERGGTRRELRSRAAIECDQRVRGGELRHQHVSRLPQPLYLPALLGGVISHQAEGTKFSSP